MKSGVIDFEIGTAGSGRGASAGASDANASTVLCTVAIKSGKPDAGNGLFETKEATMSVVISSNSWGECEVMC